MQQNSFLLLKNFKNAESAQLWAHLSLSWHFSRQRLSLGNV